MHDTDSRSIILTRATGFLGAFLMAGLLERGYHVTVLGRCSKDKRLSDRISGLVKWLGINESAENLSSVEIDFSKKHLGLDNKAYRNLCSISNKIIHCASDTSFAERNRERVLATNVSCLPTLLELASDSKTKHLFYVSTAYASGVRKGICMEEPVITSKFNNVYEESKANAEEIIRRYCEKNYVPLTIVRPSIVYGHSKTGAALKFNALYYVLKSLLTVRDIFLKDIIERGGSRSKQWGFHIGIDGTLYLPLRICLQNKGDINLIPIDYFVESVGSIIEHPCSDGIYHITSKHSPDIATLIDYSERYLDIRGVCPMWEMSGKNSDPNPAEELFDRFIEPYRPYLSDTRSFDRSRLENIIHDFSAPPLTYDIFERCMNYAIECDWGKKAGFPC